MSIQNEIVKGTKGPKGQGTKGQPSGVNLECNDSREAGSLGSEINMRDEGTKWLRGSGRNTDPLRHRKTETPADADGQRQGLLAAGSWSPSRVKMVKAWSWRAGEKRFSAA